MASHLEPSTGASLQPKQACNRSKPATEASLQPKQACNRSDPRDRSEPRATSRPSGAGLRCVCHGAGCGEPEPTLRRPQWTRYPQRTHRPRWTRCPRVAPSMPLMTFAGCLRGSDRQCRPDPRTAGSRRSSRSPRSGPDMPGYLGQDTWARIPGLGHHRVHWPFTPAEGCGGRI